MIQIRNQIEALIDKTVLTGFTITSIADPEKLLTDGILIVKNGSSKKILLENCAFDSVILPDSSLFDRFVYTYGPYGVYAELDLSIHEPLPPEELKEGSYKKPYHNLNCWHMRDLRHRIECIVSQLYSLYGITLDVSKIKFRYIEINRTFLIKDSYDLYERPIEFMLSLVRPRLRLKEHDFFSADHHTEHVSQYQRRPATFIKDSGKNGISVKIYDKGAQLNQTVKDRIFPNCIRFELTLKTPRKVREYLKSNVVSDISDEDLNQCLNAFVRDNIYDQYPKRVQLRDQYLQALLKKLSKGDDRYWRKTFLLELMHQETKSHVPLLLSLDSLRPILQLTDRDRRSRYDTMKSMRNVCTRHCATFLRGDQTRLDELLQKLLPKG